MKKIRIGTRGSKLALVQSEHVRDILQKYFPDSSIELVIIKTTGDKILDTPLSKIGDKGLFTKEIEKELLSGSIDMAVHSMKDMPTTLPEGLAIGAVTRRINPHDVFISKQGKKLEELHTGAVIATSSMRRKAQILAFNSHFTIADIRGNVQSRIKKMKEDDRIDGVILAHAGLERLDMQYEITEIISENIIIPAVGQAALAIEIREKDAEVKKLIEPLHDPNSAIAVFCERIFLAELGGGCQVPIAGLATIAGGTITLIGMVARLDGAAMFRRNANDSVANYVQLGKNLAHQLIDDGAGEILKEIYQ